MFCPKLDPINPKMGQTWDSHKTHYCLVFRGFLSICPIVLCFSNSRAMHANWLESTYALPYVCVLL